MSVFMRELKRGIMYRYQFSFREKKFTSPAIYGTRLQAEKAEGALREKLKTQITGGLSELIEKRVEDFHANRNSPDYIKESKRYFAKMLRTWGDVPVTSITVPRVHRFVRDEAVRLGENGKTCHKVNALIRVMKAFFNYCINVHGIQWKIRSRK